MVETALARALVLAAEAQRWDVVAQIAEELRRRGSAQSHEHRGQESVDTVVVDVVGQLGRSCCVLNQARSPLSAREQAFVE